MQKQIINYARIDSPVGVIHLGEIDGSLLKVSVNDPDGKGFLSWLQKRFPGAQLICQEGKLKGVLAQTAEQLLEYLSGKRKIFNLLFTWKARTSRNRYGM